MDRTKAFGYKIYSDNLEELSVDKKAVIHTINQYSYCMSMEDRAFRKALQHADVLLPDGVGITKAIKYVYGKRVIKIAGADMHAHLLEELNEQGGKCFYLGSSDATLTQIKEKIKKEYPNITVGVYSPPYKSQFSATDNEAMIAAVNEFAPNVLFVGMTAPKQEKWVESNKHLINANIICTIGAVFDFFAGTVDRAHPLFVKLGLEWFVRLVKEPKRMWKRYLFYGPVFLVQIFRFKKKNVTDKLSYQKKPENN